MGRKKKYTDAISTNIRFERADHEWIEDYAFATGTTITGFINQAVKEKIRTIELQNKLKES